MAVEKTLKGRIYWDLHMTERSGGGEGVMGGGFFVKKLNGD